MLNPVALTLGPIQIHWYGLMYLFGFIAAYIVGRLRIKQNLCPLTRTQLDDFIFLWMVLAVILGGRLGYVLFYQWNYFLSNPFYLFKIWEGGMSFHGGLLGVAIGTALYGRVHCISFLQLADLEALMIPFGLFFGRMGNFINGELWGRVTSQPWGMIFSEAGPLPRHPSQLYEAFFEGIVLGGILWWFAQKPRKSGAIAGLFLLGYGVFRIVLEYFREPDAHIGFILGGVMTQGQLLCIPMILAGILMMIYPRRRH